MEKTRTAVSAPTWLLVNLAAMGFSLVHTMGDLGLAPAQISSSRSVMQPILLTTLIGLTYTWWAWLFARAVARARSGFIGLMAFDILWVGISGLTIVFCMPPCSNVPYYADTIHLGNLILSPFAAFLAYRAMIRATVPESRFAMVGNVITMLALLVALFAMLASIFNA